LEAADVFGDLKESPLTQALAAVLMDERESLEGADQSVAVVPYGATSAVVRRRSRHLEMVLEMATPGRCVVTTIPEARQDAVVLQSIILLGSPASFGQSIITCPIAERTHFIFYDFVAKTGEEREWEHPLKSLVPKGTDLPVPHWARFDRYGHQHDCCMELADHRMYEVADADLFPVLTFHDRVRDAWHGENTDAERQECVLLDLEARMWAGVVGRVRRFACKAGRWSVERVEPEDLRSGDLILLLTREPSNLAETTEGHLQQTHGQGHSLWTMIQELGREEIEIHGWSAVGDRLVQAGIPIPYRYWFDEGRLGPQSEVSFRRLCDALGVRGEEACSAWEAMRAWQSYRIQYGHHLVGQFEQRALQILRKEGKPEDALRIVGLGDPDCGNYALVYVHRVGEHDSLPNTKTGRVLTSSGQPWRDVDLGKNGSRRGP
jgi:hypothetical protein